MATLMHVSWKVAYLRLSALWAYLTPVQRPSAPMKHSVGLHGQQQAEEPTESVVAQLLAVAKHGGFSQHLLGWQTTGHVTQKNLAKL
jgi:hypothetical protein